jgi:hypothetical protein
MHEANKCLALPNSPNKIRTIIDPKQCLNVLNKRMLNKRELNTMQQNPINPRRITVE